MAPRKNADIRLYLQQQLVERCRKNPNYSLRSFARSLNLGPSDLSKIIRGKRKVSAKMFERLATALELSPEERERLNPKLSKQCPQYLTLEQDLFEVISDGLHYTLLELTHLEHFRPDPRWIASCLNVSILEVQSCVERLQRIGFLEIDEQGNWSDKAGYVTTVGNDFTKVAFKKLQRQVLQKSLQALDTCPYELRDHSSITMAINSEKLEEAKELIKQFRRNLCNFLEEGQRDQVYNLGISLYPLTNGKEN